MHAYSTPLDLVRERPPERPVALVRPGVLAVAARWFQDHIAAETFYAVKANPAPWVIRALAEAGVGGFDVASLPEIEAARAAAPGARLAFMNPVKSERAIAAAFFDHGVTAFALDSQGELDKIRRAIGPGAGLDLIVRLAVRAPGAALPLDGKFGVELEESAELLLAARRGGARMGVAFHVGSQCMDPTAFETAMAQASRALARAGVLADIVDVGGGFPSLYPGLTPPPMEAYAQALARGFATMNVPESAQLWCEPGRALVAEAASMLLRVELRRGDTLHLNDGAFGSLYDAAHLGWRYPARAVRESEGAGPLRAFDFAGPTCDAADVMPGPFMLPADIDEGDYIEIGGLGAYGAALASRFNGFGEIEEAEVASPPLASMYGLVEPGRALAPRESRR